MTFAGIALSEFFWLFGGLAVATILIFLFLQRKRGKDISSLLIWKRVTGSRRSIWHDLASLLLQLLFLLLVVLALTDPRILPEKRETQRLALVFDTSASMGAKFESTTRLGQAKEQARKLVADLGEEDRAMIISAGSQLAPLTPFTQNGKDLDEALDKMVPRGGGERLAEAIEYAVSALDLTKSSSAAKRRVIVFTDQPRDLAQLSEDEDLVIEENVISDPQQNLGITAFDVRKTFNLTPGHEVLVRVANFGYSPVTANLELATSRSVIGQATLSIQPRQEVQRVYYLPFGVAGKIRARLSAINFAEGEDGFRSDNEAFAFLPVRPRIDVLLVTDGGRFMENALRVNPQISLKKLPTAGYQPSAAKGYDLVIFDNLSAPLPKSGHVMYINPAEKGSYFSIVKTMEKPVFSGWEAGHPLLRYITLNDLFLKEARVLKVEEGDKNLIGTLDGSLLLLRKDKERQVLGVGFDIERSDLPLRVAFPVMMHNLVTWLTETPDDNQKLLYAVGETVELPIAQKGISEIKMQAPGGGEFSVPVQDGSIAFKPQEPGFYTYADGENKLLAPVSFILPEESDLLAGVGKAQTVSAAAVAIDSDPGRKYRTLLLLIAIAILMLDWILFHYGRIN